MCIHTEAEAFSSQLVVCCLRWFIHHRQCRFVSFSLPVYPLTRPRRFCFGEETCCKKPASRTSNQKLCVVAGVLVGGVVKLVGWSESVGACGHVVGCLLDLQSSRRCKGCTRRLFSRAYSARPGWTASATGRFSVHNTLPGWIASTTGRFSVHSTSPGWTASATGRFSVDCHVTFQPHSQYSTWRNRISHR